MEIEPRDFFFGGGGVVSSIRACVCVYAVQICTCIKPQLIISTVLHVSAIRDHQHIQYSYKKMGKSCIQ